MKFRKTNCENLIEKKSEILILAYYSQVPYNRGGWNSTGGGGGGWKL